MKHGHTSGHGQAKAVLLLGLLGIQKNKKATGNDNSPTYSPSTCLKHAALSRKPPNPCSSLWLPPNGLKPVIICFTWPPRCDLAKKRVMKPTCNSGLLGLYFEQTPAAKQGTGRSFCRQNQWNANWSEPIRLGSLRRGSSEGMRLAVLVSLFGLLF